MYLTGHILTLNNTGAPDYNICGQATSILSFTNMSFKLSISKNGSAATILINTADLSTLNVGTLPYGTINYGDYDINFISFNRNNITSSYVLEVQVYTAGTTNIVIWEKFNVIIEVSKSGYQSFLNSFELYNYDVGNDATLGYLGNTNFDIILVDNTNNLDINGNQTRVGSNFLTLRRPFTNEVHFYSMIGTQGSIEYYDITNFSIPIGFYKHGIVISEEDITIEQQIVLSNASNCSSQQLATKKIWFPIFTSTYTPSDSCGECTNNLTQIEIAYTSDASTTSIFKIGNVSYFLHQFMNEVVLTEIYDYNGNVVTTNTTSINLTYSAWTSNPATFLTPTVYTVIPSTIGDNVIKVTHTYNALAADASILAKLYECYYTYLLPTCNWWTVTANEDCTSYTVTNCSLVDISVEIQMLNDNKTYDTISTTIVPIGETLDLSFLVDGIYILKVNKDGDPDSEYYTLPIYCALQDCLMKYVSIALCQKVSDDCIEKTNYSFNAFLITAHTYFLLLNKEMNYNFVYTTISVNKTEELYTMSIFINRFKEYCLDSTSPCLPCNQ